MNLSGSGESEAELSSSSSSQVEVVGVGQQQQQRQRSQSRSSEEESDSGASSSGRRCRSLSLSGSCSSSEEEEETPAEIKSMSQRGSRARGSQHGGMSPVSSASSSGFTLTPPLRRSSPRFSPSRSGGGSDHTSSRLGTPGDNGTRVGTRRPSSRSSPRQRSNSDEGYDRVPGRPRPETHAGVGNGGSGSKGSPLDLLSSQDSSSQAQGRRGDGAQQAGSARTGKSGKKGKASKKMWGGDGEKVLFHLLIQKHCPSQHATNSAKRGAWAAILRELREQQHEIVLTDHTGTERRVDVDMGPTMDGQEEEQLIKKLKDVWGQDRRVWKAAQSADKRKTGEGATDEEETSVVSEEKELEAAVQAWDACKSSKREEKVQQAEHKEKAQDIRTKFTEDPPGPAPGAGQAGIARVKGTGRAHGARGTKRKASATSAGSDDLAGGESSKPPRRSASTSGRSSTRQLADERDSSSSDDGEASIALLDKDATSRASGRGGRSTREGKDGARRKREVAPLSSGARQTGLEGKMGKLLDVMLEERVQRSRGQSRGHGSQSGGSAGGAPVTHAEYSHGMDALEGRIGETVKSAINAAFQQSQQPVTHFAQPPLSSFAPGVHGSLTHAAAVGVVQPPFGMHAATLPIGAGTAPGGVGRGIGASAGTPSAVARVVQGRSVSSGDMGAGRVGRGIGASAGAASAVQRVVQGRGASSGDMGAAASTGGSLPGFDEASVRQSTGATAAGPMCNCDPPVACRKTARHPVNGQLWMCGRYDANRQCGYSAPVTEEAAENPAIRATRGGGGSSGRERQGGPSYAAATVSSTARAAAASRSGWTTHS